MVVIASTNRNAKDKEIRHKNKKTKAKNFVKRDMMLLKIAKGRFIRKLKNHKEDLIKKCPYCVLERKTRETYLVELKSDTSISTEFNTTLIH